MKILINAIILSSKNTGLGVYTYNLLENIVPKLIENNHEFNILVSNIDYLPNNCKEYALVVQYKGFIQRNRILNKIDLTKYDLVWSTTHHGKTKIKNKQIITIHDLIPYLYPKGRIHQFIYYKFFLKNIIKKCDYILTVSENTKKDIAKLYKFDNKRIINAYESIERHKCENIRNIDISDHFTITGIHYNYKNIHVVIEAFNKFSDLRKYRVYIIGNDNCKYGNFLKKMVSNYNLNDNIIFTGFLSNEEKYKLIKTSISTIYPSLYEGFGLPILEAMDMGVPVISSNSSSLPEVGGDAAIFFDPNSVDDLHDKILYVINEANREEIINKGYMNLERFTWDKTCKIIIDLLNNIK